MGWQFAVVFLGGGLGSAGRHGVNLLAARLVGTQYPVGTFLINLLGSFAMGAVVEYFAARSGLAPQARLFLTTGVIGGFTTFSTFSLESAQLLDRGEPAAALVYIMGSAVLGVASLYLGMLAARMLPGG